MIVGISGGRDFLDFRKFSTYMDEIRKHIDIDTIISGGAKGTDELAYRYSVKNGITFICCPPRPEDGYPAKFFIRNERIVNSCDILIAFPTEKSKGTYHAIEFAKKIGRDYKVIRV